MRYKRATSPKQVQPGRQYSVILFENVHFEGDERSRTNPGHGYPAHTETYSNLLLFDSKEQVENWVIENEERSFLVMEMIPLQVEKSVKLSLKETS